MIPVDKALQRRVNLDDISWLCSTCARKLGGAWPRGHLATITSGPCEVCRKDSAITTPGDWDWPDGKTRGEWS